MRNEITAKIRKATSLKCSSKSATPLQIDQKEIAERILYVPRYGASIILDNKNYQPFKLRTKNWVVVRNDANYSSIITLSLHRNCYGIFSLIYKDTNTLSVS